MISELFSDKTKKVKEKTSLIAEWLLMNSLSTDELVAFAENAQASTKATCIEAFEFATKHMPAIADEKVLHFVTKSLLDKAPRIKWESAKVIGNIAHLFPTKLNKAIASLLSTAEHDGTVVRWAVAYALGKILKLNTRHNKALRQAVKVIAEKEKNAGVRKKYLGSLRDNKN